MTSSRMPARMTETTGWRSASSAPPRPATSIWSSEGRWGAARFDETAGCGRGHRNRRSEPWIRSAATSPRGRRRAPTTLTPAPPRAVPGRSVATPPVPSSPPPPPPAPARRKLAAVTRLLRGEPLETVARELNVTVARLSAWRDRALVAAEAAMKERERDSRDEELLRLKAKLGEVTMANELLEQKIAALEGGRPLGRRRSRR